MRVAVEVGHSQVKWDESLPRRGFSMPKIAQPSRLA